MITSQTLDLLSPWLIFFLITVSLLLVFEASIRSGRIIQKRWPDKSDAGVGTKVSAALTILALLLAFIINFSINIFNGRRQLVVSEANAIGTAYLRSGYLSEPYKAESRQLLRDYLEFRLQVVDPTKSEDAITRSELMQDRLWILAEDLARTADSPSAALYILSLNEVFNLHTERLNAEMEFRVPAIMIYGMFGVSVLTMILIGINDGYHERDNRIALIVLVLILSLVFLLLIGLDRSNAGPIQVPLKPLFNLQQKLPQLP
jgi:hypothetical protein